MHTETKYGTAIELFAVALGVVQAMIPQIPLYVGWPIVALLFIGGALLIRSGRKKRKVEHNKQFDIQIPELLLDINEYEVKLSDMKIPNISNENVLKDLHDIMNGSLFLMGIDENMTRPTTIPITNEYRKVFNKNVPKGVINKLQNPKESIPILMEIGGLIDSKGMGIQSKRDSKYRKLKNKLNQLCLYITDEELNKLKNEYLQSSYATSSFVQLRNYYKLLASHYEGIYGFNIIPPEVDSFLALINQGVEKHMSEKLELIKTRLKQIGGQYGK